jgi:hypothetical protein
MKLFKNKKRVIRLLFSGLGFVLLIGMILLSSKAGKFGFVVLLGFLAILALLPKKYFKNDK